MTGNQFEVNLIEIFKRLGFWAHQMAKGRDGSQPFDVLVCNDGHFVPIECKVVSHGKRFDLKYVRENQINSYKLMYSKPPRCGAWLAVCFEESREIMFYGMGHVIGLIESSEKSINFNKCIYEEFLYGMLVKSFSVFFYGLSPSPREIINDVMGWGEPG